MHRASLTDHAALKRCGLYVARFDGTPSGWTLEDRNDVPGFLMIGSHGCVAPTEWEAVAEGLSRIAVGLYEASHA